MIFYSKLRNSFFDDRFKVDYDLAGSWPEDAKEISQEEYITYSSTPPIGKVLVSDKKGSPSWVDKPEPSDDELKSLAEQKKTALMASAENAIAPLYRAVRLGIATDKEAKTLEKWEMYTVLLMRVNPSSPEWPSEPD